MQDQTIPYNILRWGQCLVAPSCMAQVRSGDRAKTIAWAVLGPSWGHIGVILWLSWAHFEKAIVSHIGLWGSTVKLPLRELETTI